MTIGQIQPQHIGRNWFFSICGCIETAIICYRFGGKPNNCRRLNRNSSIAIIFVACSNNSYQPWYCLGTTVSSFFFLQLCGNLSTLKQITSFAWQPKSVLRLYASHDVCISYKVQFVFFSLPPSLSLSAYIILLRFLSQEWWIFVECKQYTLKSMCPGIVMLVRLCCRNNDYKTVEA